LSERPGSGDLDKASETAENQRIHWKSEDRDILTSIPNS